MELNSNQIQELIPHRYPFLLVDKIAISRTFSRETHYAGGFDYGSTGTDRSSGHFVRA